MEQVTEGRDFFRLIGPSTLASFAESTTTEKENRFSLLPKNAIRSGVAAEMALPLPPSAPASAAWPSAAPTMAPKGPPMAKPATPPSILPQKLKTPPARRNRPACYHESRAGL